MNSTPEPPPIQTSRAQFFRLGSRSERPSRVWVRVTRSMASGFVVIALLGAIPTLPTWQSLATTGMPIWALGLLLAGFLQVVFALYMTLWPSSASLLTTAAFGLTLTATYALLFVVRLLVPDDHTWSRAWQLDINAFSASQEALWCVVMLLLTGLWTYFAGRVSLLGRQWERTR